MHPNTCAAGLGAAGSEPSAAAAGSSSGAATAGGCAPPGDPASCFHGIAAIAEWLHVTPNAPRTSMHPLAACMRCCCMTAGRNKPSPGQAALQLALPPQAHGRPLVPAAPPAPLPPAAAVPLPPPAPEHSGMMRLLHISQSPAQLKRRTPPPRCRPAAAALGATAGRAPRHPAARPAVHWRQGQGQPSVRSGPWPHRALPHRTASGRVAAALPPRPRGRVLY